MNVRSRAAAHVAVVESARAAPERVRMQLAARALPFALGDGVQLRPEALGVPSLRTAVAKKQLIAVNPSR